MHYVILGLWLLASLLVGAAVLAAMGGVVWVVLMLWVFPAVILERIRIRTRRRYSRRHPDALPLRGDQWSWW